jgi:hypothetical protein
MDDICHSRSVVRKQKRECAMLMRLAFGLLLTATPFAVSGLLLTPAAMAETDTAAQPQTNAPECHLDVNTDKGSGGVQAKICDDHASIGFSGPMKDVTWQTPTGGTHAAIPQALTDIGHAGNEVGKIFSRAFGW